MGKKIGILVTGHAPEDLTAEYGEYSDMFGAMLKAVDPSIEAGAIDIVAGESPPADPDAYDGYIITGSRHGVYEDLPWIAPLEEFIRKAAQRRTPNVGICFGHQLIAQAFGGRVEKSSKGWGLGMRLYEPRTGWTDTQGNGAPMIVPSANQDQVIKAPATARVIMGSSFCPLGGLEHPGCAVSMQFHPEFTVGYLEALITSRRGEVIPEHEAALGLSTISGGDDGCSRMAKWIVRHFNGGGTV